MNDLPPVNGRIKDLINLKTNGNVSKFSELIGVVPQKVNRLFNIDTRTQKYPDPLKTDIIDRIEKAFPDVRKLWILAGDGEMIAMEGKSLNINYQKEVDGAVRNGDTVTQVDSDNYMEVEYRDLSVAAGPLNRTDIVEKKTMLVPREYDRGEYLVCRVDGPSMDDGSIYSIPEGAKILVKRFYLDKGDKLPIRGNLFVIDAKDGQALKQIVEHNTELGYIKCHSYNEDFADYTVPLDEIFGFYIFRKIVAFRPPVRDVNQD